MTEPRTHPRVGALLVLALLSALAVFALYGFAVQTESGQDLDASVYEGPQREPGLGARQGESILQTISVGTLGLVTIGIMALAITRRRPWLVVIPPALIGGSLLVTELLKHVILERPDLLAAGETTNSYPSGHTTIAIAIGIAGLLVVPPWLRPAAGLGAIAFASAVGVSTVAAGWHRPSDVVGAYLVTIAVAALLVALFRVLAPPAPGGDRGGAEVPWAISLGIVAGLAVAFAISLIGAAGEVDWTTVDRGFLASAIALPAAAAALVSTLAVAIWGRDVAAPRAGPDL